MRRQRLPVLLLLGLATAGCDDVTGPCARAFACQVEGVDLFVAELEILADQRDPDDGRGIIEAGLAGVRVRVRNRGTESSTPTRVALGYGAAGGSAVTFPDTLPIPGLPPGGSWEGRATLRTWDGSPGDPGPALAHATATVLLADADTTNNHRASAPVHVRLTIVPVQMSAGALRQRPRTTAAAPGPRPSSSPLSTVATTPRGW